MEHPPGVGETADTMLRSRVYRSQQPWEQVGVRERGERRGKREIGWWERGERKGEDWVVGERGEERGREGGDRVVGGRGEKRVVERSIGGTADGSISLFSQLLSQFCDAGDVLHARV